MTYIQEVVVRGPGGKREFGMSADKHVNVIFGRNAVGKTTLLNVLRSALLGDSSLLRNVHFTSAEVRLFSEKETKTYRCILEKKENAAGSATRGGDAVSAWRVEPEPKGVERPMWPHLYLPTSRHYSSHSKYAIFHQHDGAKGKSRRDRPEQGATHTLYALWKEYHHHFSEQGGQAIEDGKVGVLNTFFSKEERQKRIKLKSSPESDYSRVCSYLEKHGLNAPIISYSTFKKARQYDAGIKRIIHQINLAEAKIDRLDAERKKAGELAAEMLGGGKEISIGLDGLRITSKRNEPIGWSALSAGERNALILLFATLGARGGVLLVDDVEASLHHDLRHDLIKNMRTLNPAGQFILTTHSGEIVDSVDKGQRFRMEG